MMVMGTALSLVLPAYCHFRFLHEKGLLRRDASPLERLQVLVGAL